MTPEEYLRTKGFKIRHAPGELETQCPFCGDTNKYGHLYVNREHGAFICHRCGETGSFRGLQVKLGDKPEEVAQGLAEKAQVWANVVRICQDALLGQEDALDYLRSERGFEPSTIGKYKIGWVPRDMTDQLFKKFTLADLRHAGLMNDQDYPLFWDRLLIPYFNRGQVVALRAKQIGGNVIQAKNTSIRLFGTDNLRGRGEVFVCEGEFDAMYLDQLGFPSCAIPGALSFQDLWSMYFEEAKRAFVVLDSDDAGRKGAVKISSILKKRARIVDLPVPTGEKTTDITEYFRRDLHTKDDFLALIDQVRGQRVYMLGDALRERNELRGREGLKLGFRDLDYSIHPGLLPGQVVTVLAKTGVGKTAFITQLVHNMSSWQPFNKATTGPGVPVLFLSLEQTKAEIAERLERIAHLYNPWADTAEVEQWHSKMRICDENRIPPEDIGILVNEFIDDVGEAPRLFVVDYLGYWSRSFPSSSSYERVSEAIMELKRLAKLFNVAVVAPHQVSRVGRSGERLELDFARDSGVVEETSDFVFSLFRPNQRRDEDEQFSDYRSQADVRLEILKSRHGNVGKQVMMLWAPYSLALIPRGDDLERVLEREWKALREQKMYDEVLEFLQGKVHI